MTRLTAKDAQALLPKRSKMGNKPVWECQQCWMLYWTRPTGRIYPELVCQCGASGPRIWKFASGREHTRWCELKRDEKAGQIRNLRRQVSYRLEVNGKLICTYRSDASYEEPKKISDAREPWGTIWLPVVEDSKGYATPVYKLKKKLMAAGACPEFPAGIDIRET